MDPNLLNSTVPCSPTTYDALAPWFLGLPLALAVVCGVLAGLRARRGVPIFPLVLLVGGGCACAAWAAAFTYRLSTLPFRRALPWSAREIETCNITYWTGDGSYALRARVPREDARAYLAQWATAPTLWTCSFGESDTALTLDCSRASGQAEMYGSWSEGTLRMTLYAQ